MDADSRVLGLLLLPRSKYLSMGQVEVENVRSFKHCSANEVEDILHKFVRKNEIIGAK
jgi:hypothetical protein